MVLLAQSKNYLQNKALISNDIPVSAMKQFANCYCEKLTNILNDCLKENRLSNTITDLKVRYLISLNFLRASFIHN